MSSNNQIKGKIFVTIIGFVLTGVLGSMLSVIFNYMSMVYKDKYDERKALREEKKQHIEEIVDLCQQRSFWTQKWWNAVKDNSSNCDDIKKQLDKVVENWNLKLLILSIKTRVLVNDKLALLIIDENTHQGELSSKDDIKCMHAAYLYLHKRIYNYSSANSENKKEKEIEIWDLWDKLKSIQLEVYKICFENYK